MTFLSSGWVLGRVRDTSEQLSGRIISLLRSFFIIYFNTYLKMYYPIIVYDLQPTIHILFNTLTIEITQFLLRFNVRIVAERNIPQIVRSQPKRVVV